MAVSQEIPRPRRDARYERLRAAASFYRAAALLLLIVAVAEFGIILWQAHRTRFARAVRINDRVVCFVRNERAADQVRERLLKTRKGELPGAAFLEQKWEDLNWPMDRSDKILPVPEAVETLRPKVTIKVSAAAIQVGDQELVVLPTADLAQMTLDLLKKDYSAGSGKLIEADFLQKDVRIVPTKAQPRAILANVHEAVKKLKAPHEGLDLYLVKDGDSWRKMASAHNISFEGLRKLNPLFSDIAPVGKKIKVPARKKPLTVVTVKEETREEAVKAKPQRIETSTMPEGERRVTVKGKDGKKLITEKVTYHNGREVSRKTINEVVTVKPVAERVMVGTARPPREREPAPSASSP